MDVLPLLSSPNKCDLQITENLLLNSNKYKELVMYYESKELHKKALELLKKVGNPNERPSSSHSNNFNMNNNISEDSLNATHTIHYLSSLNKFHFPLILEFSRWVLEAEPTKALTIFTTTREESVDLPHKEVYEHIKSITSQKKENLALKYLEFVIEKKGENDPSFHNELIFVYLDNIVTLKHILPFNSHNESEKTEVTVKAGTEPGLLGQYRKKLLVFLENSSFYKAETMLSRFPQNDLFEEKAILFSRIGRHDQALSIYAYKLKDSQMAEQYCAKHFESSTEEGKDVYLSLLKVYLSPSENYSPMIDPALELLNKHYKRMDVAKAIELIPPFLSLDKLHHFFESVLQELVLTKRSNQILLSILKSQELNVREQHSKSRSRVIKIWDNTICPLCQRPLQNAVFVSYPLSKLNPHGKVVHLACFRKENEENN
eukprot:TRINITY_DN132_c0_g2_i1.p1 TRINITY_DN132_c0_g2~~TRINITY_DN132_c0_g2_i1.p1  ORF type:complete len:480 (+),score=145.39 TRINITY_DN132_c0_g2_i1:145-1440(+)